MFDEVVCECDLPDGLRPDERNFQTKSLHKCLDKYTITKDGRLIHHWVRYEAVEPEPEPPPDAPPESPIERWRRLRPRREAVEKKDLDMCFHGYLRLTSLREDPDQELLDFAARFTHGRMEWFGLLKDLPEPERDIAENVTLSSW